MKRYLTVLLLSCIFLCTSAIFAAEANEVVIEIPCKTGENVIAYVDGERSFDLGKVLKVPSGSRWPAYTASVWGTESTVCASAVNAIHLLVSKENGRGRTISILPSGTFAPAAGEGTSFVIETQPGFGLFGAFAPPVGSRITIKNMISGTQDPLNHESLECVSTSMMIRYNTSTRGYLIDIENRPGGRVVYWNDTGAKLIARVIRPVYGVGRFGGTSFQRNGRLRANHPGVIDISTSPYGTIGGFQIIPLFHAHSHEMKSAWQLTQWMILAPPKGFGSLKGQPPLFSGILSPGTQKGEKLWDLWSTYGRRPLILARINGGKWQDLPAGIMRNDAAMNNITHFRIYLPVDRIPLD